MGRSIISVLRCGLRPGWGSDFLPSLWGMGIFSFLPSLFIASESLLSVSSSSYVNGPSPSRSKSLVLPRFEETLSSRSYSPRREGARPCRLTAGRWVTTAESLLDSRTYSLSRLVGFRVPVRWVTLSVSASEFTNIFSNVTIARITLFFDLGRNAVKVFGSDVTNSLNILSLEPGTTVSGLYAFCGSVGREVIFSTLGPAAAPAAGFILHAILSQVCGGPPQLPRRCPTLFSAPLRPLLPGPFPFFPMFSPGRREVPARIPMLCVSVSLLALPLLSPGMLVLKSFIFSFYLLPVAALP